MFIIGDANLKIHGQRVGKKAHIIQINKLMFPDYKCNGKNEALTHD